MSLITEIHRRAPVPFEYAKREFETQNMRAIGDDWAAFLRYWAQLNYDAAEAFASVSRERAEAFKQAQGAAREAANG